MANESAVAMFRSKKGVEAAVNELHRAQFDVNNLSIVCKDSRDEEGATGIRGHVQRLASAIEHGATWGHLLGVVIKATQTAPPVRSFAFPNAGPLIALGPIVGAIEGAGNEDALGVLEGALVSVGVAAENVESYEKRIAGGELVVVAQGSSDEVERARGAFRQTSGAFPIA